MPHAHHPWYGFAGVGAAPSGSENIITGNEKADDKALVERICKELTRLQEMEDAAILYTAEGT